MSSKCPICGTGIGFWSLYHDKSHGFRLHGDIRLNQDVTACIGCDTMMHTECVQQLGQTLPGQFIRYAGPRTRERVDPLYPAYNKLAVCISCHDRLVTDTLKNLEASGNYEPAALFLEHLGRWEEAGVMRRKARTQTVRNVNVDLNALLDRIRLGGMVVDYRCPSCGVPLRVDGRVKEAGLTSCPYCRASIDTATAVRLIEQALEG